MAGLKLRIKELCAKAGISMNKLEEELGFGKGYISKLGVSNPNTAKLQKIADYFSVTLDFLMTGQDKAESEYYTDSDTKELADFLRLNPDYQVLFDATRKVRREDIELVKQMLERFGDDSFE